MSRPGLILFAHGARDPAWAAPFEAVAQAVRDARPDLALRLAYLEAMAPGLLEAGRELGAIGCSDVAVLPLFLGSGGHLRKDLPPLVDRLRVEWPAVRWTLHPAVGESATVIGAMAAVALQLVPVPAAGLAP